MQQYSQPLANLPLRATAAKAEPNLIEARLIALANSLSEQNALQARQIRRLESDIAQLKEAQNRRAR